MGLFDGLGDALGSLARNAGPIATGVFSWLEAREQADAAKEIARVQGGARPLAAATAAGPVAYRPSAGVAPFGMPLTSQLPVPAPIQIPTVGPVGTTIATEVGTEVARRAWDWWRGTGGGAPTPEATEGGRMATCPTFVGPTGAPTVRMVNTVQVPGPNGRIHWYKNMGQPILFRGDLAAAKRVRKVASMLRPYGPRSGGYRRGR